MIHKKQHVLDTAKQLFLEKGYRTTSIHDIIEASRISKGTFYNYFKNKGELIEEVIHDFYDQLEVERDAILVGEDPADMDVFIKQMEFLVGSRDNQGFLLLFEELLSSPEVEMKQLIKAGKLRLIYWLQKRFVEIFGERKKPYYLDCAVLFIGYFSQCIAFRSWMQEKTIDKSKIVEYSVRRLIEMVQQLSGSGDQLFHPSEIYKMLTNFSSEKECIAMKLSQLIQSIKEQLPVQTENSQWLDFIYEEVTLQKTPRKFVLDQAIKVLENEEGFSPLSDFESLKLLLIEIDKKTD